VKLLGLVGGVSWESTAYYYQLLNRAVRERLGGRHSARLVMHSVDFAPVEAASAAYDWDTVAVHMIAAARSVEAGGAEAILLCANTMHRVAPEVAEAVGLPLIHIADATAEALLAAGARKPLLLGTRYTMELNFYREILAAHGVGCVTPPAADRDELNRIIFDELVVGVFKPEAKAAMLRMIAEARDGQGCDAVIFGCTELGLLATPAETPLPVFDTAEIHVAAALKFAFDD
jgi:aspartate racemase